MVKALFKDSNRKLKVQKQVGKYQVSDLIEFKHSPNKYSYSSGEENFDEDLDEEKDINPVYSKKISVGGKQPAGPPSFVTKVVKRIRNSELGKTIHRRFTVREEGDHDSSDDEDKKKHWADFILSIFRKKPKVEFYESEEDEDTPIIEAYYSKEEPLDN